MGSKTVAIIGARLSSKRLPGKQLLPLAGQPLIAHISNRLKQVPQIAEIIVATTDEAVNAPLCEWAESYGVTAFAWNGDQNDVVGRVDAAFKASGADRFVYVCGDCPFIEPKTIERLVQASEQIASDGFARLTPAKNGKPYIHEGFDVFNRSFWESMVDVAHEPFEREHIGAVCFHLNKVQPSEISETPEDEVFTEVEHRLSVDTQQDYAFATALYDRWYKRNPPTSIVDLKWVIGELRRDENLVSINAHVHQKAVEEVVPIVKVLCEAGPGVGMGHLSRACVAAQSLQEYAGADVELLIKGTPTEFGALTLIRHQWVQGFDAKIQDANCVVVDLKTIGQPIVSILKTLERSVYRIGVDVFDDKEGLFDLLWGPAVYAEEDKLSQSVLSRLRYGPDCFLLRRAEPAKPDEASAEEEKSIIVLTGGADPAKLSASLPALLDARLPENVQIDWVQGPYADEPCLPENTKRFNVLKAPADLHQAIAGYDLALCVFGVTFFECLNAGTPVVAFDPIGAATEQEWDRLKALAPDLLAENRDEAIGFVAEAFSGRRSIRLPELAGKLPLGPKNFADAVIAGVKQDREASDAAA